MQNPRMCLTHSRLLILMKIVNLPTLFRSPGLQNYLCNAECSATWHCANRIFASSAPFDQKLKLETFFFLKKTQKKLFFVI